MQKYRQFFYFLSNLLTLTNSLPCNYLPPNCRYVKYRSYSDRQQTIVMKHSGFICEPEFDETALQAVHNATKPCAEFSFSILSVAIKSSPRREIVDESFGVFKIGKYLKQYTFRNLIILNSKGFDIDSSSRINVDDYGLLLFYSDFNLYRQNRLVKGCDDEFNGSQTKSTNSTTRFPFYQEFSFFFIFQISKPKPVYPICSSFFSHANLAELSLAYMAKSFFLKNTVSFVDPNIIENDAQPSIVGRLNVYNSYGIDIDASFLNRRVFSSTRFFSFDCQINSIQNEVFAHFTDSNTISFDSEYVLSLIKRQGIKWIQNINTHLNFTNSDLNYTNIQLLSTLLILDFSRDSLLDRNYHFAYDKDFCLFAEFPFSQLAFFVTYARSFEIFYRNNTSTFSCTELWLFQFYEIFYQLGYFKSEYARLRASNFEACDFNARISMCDKKNFNKSSSRTNLKFSWFDSMLFIQVIFIFMAPVLGAWGIATNLMTIYVILHNENKKTMREKHYLFMCAHCVSNVLICLIQIVNLVNECQIPLGIFCSAIGRVVAVQYVKIVTGEFFNCFFRLFSNFAYLSFSFCRLSKVGNNHGDLVVFMNDLSMKTNVTVAILVSACFSVCKSLQFDINMDRPEFSFPLPFVQNPERFGWNFKAGYVVIIVINALYDLINYFLFVFVHLIVDLVLIKKLRDVIVEKETKLREMKFGKKEMEKAEKENDDSMRRTLFMVLLTSVFNFGTKIPSIIASMNDLRLLILKPFELPNQYDPIMFQFDFFNPSYSFQYFCYAYNSCLTLQHMGNCLFLVSIITVLFFLKRFDKNFKIAYFKVFSQNSRITKS